MGKALVILAAGLGTRYGGNKQSARVGPGGEVLMEYAAYDAVRAGFDRIVIIIKPEMRGGERAVFGDLNAARLGVELYFPEQTIPEAWEGIPIPAEREKPLGTLHALLCARDYLDRPFAVINADDYYGQGAFASVGRALDGLRGGADCVLAAYRLKNTVSPYGSVTRGVCAVDGGYLRHITETYRISLDSDGSIRDLSAPGSPAFDPDTPVSMNLWGFHPDILPPLEEEFRHFLTVLQSDPRREMPLPVAMDALLGAGKVRCRVLDTEERWFGMTYPQDKPIVVEALRKLHDSGVYPPALWT